MRSILSLYRCIIAWIIESRNQQTEKKKEKQMAKNKHKVPSENLAKNPHKKNEEKNK